MKPSSTKVLIAKITILLLWILILYQVPALVTNQSKIVEIFNRYSLWYFVILLGYLAFFLSITFVGIWFFKSSQAENFANKFDSFLSDKQDQVLIGFLVVWFVWIILNQLLFFPVKVNQGINYALFVSAISLILLYTPSEELNPSFFISNLIIPLCVLSFYLVTFMYLLPEGVNKVFVTRSTKLFLPLTIVVLIAFSSVFGFGKPKLQVLRTNKEKLNLRDLTLVLLPLTPVVQYMINNSEILAWYEYIVIFCLFLMLAGLLILVIPLLFNRTGSMRTLMFLGLAFSFLITNMAAMSWQYKWHNQGSLKIQLLVLGGIWLISWIIFKTNYRGFLYLLIALNFLSNSIVQFTDQDVEQSPSGGRANNMLMTMTASREPVITPSIYLLVYDSYVINETMLAYGIDNQDQEDYLEGLGFEIYPHTYSVASLSTDSMSRVLNSSFDYYGNERRAVSGDGVVQNLLVEYGYKTFGVFPMDFFFRGVKPSYSYWFPEPRSSILLLKKAILIGELRFDIDFDVVPREKYIQEKRTILTDASQESRFVYTHSKLPDHSTNSGVCRPNEVELFSERLTIANAEMRQDLELLLENDPEAIVVVAGDHGPQLTKNCTETRKEYDISEITRLDIQDRNGTFLAIRWPTEDFDEYDDITILQDIFPAVFAYIFKDPDILQSKIEPTTVNGKKLSGVEVSEGIIIGGMHDGEALFP
jgi:hypothetical protein